MQRNYCVNTRPKEIIELELTAIVAGGKAIGRAPDGRVVFVSYAIPGEQVMAEVTEASTQYFEARTVRVSRPSSFRVKPRCQYFGQCGGCQLQHVEYNEQLRIKRQIVWDQLVRVGKFSDDYEHILCSVIGMERPWNYRNHMRFAVWGNGQVGLMRQGTRQLLRINQCDIACAQINQALEIVQDVTEGIKQLVMRVGFNTGDALIYPQLTWRNNGINPPLESGQKNVKEALLGSCYQISASVFFQVNTIQAERLLEYVIDKVIEVRPHVVVDAYAGVGVFASHLSAYVGKVFAIEESLPAATDAVVNLAGLSNVEWVIARVEDILKTRNFSPDVVIVDPPRRGLPAKVIELLVASSACRIVYVSCDSATLARDLRRLVDLGFGLREVQPIDMFPHTQHIECVAILDRVSAP
tara:strand:+ start:3471 stop:4703 length:1233 start_codon:yes stop_codon:yes gene_type:complete